jgi:ABC-type transporter Mla subunit MlaD
MAKLNTLKSAGADTAKDIGEKVRHGAHTTSAHVQRGGEQAYEQARFGLQKAQVAVTIGTALLQGLLRLQEKQARKNAREATHQARHVRSTVQDRLQPTLSKTQELLQEGRETAQDTLQSGWETSQRALKKNAKRARKRLKKTQKNLKHMQKAVQENVESGLSRVQENLKSGWSATQDTVEGSQQVLKRLTQVGSNARDTRKAMQKRYKHYQRKRARGRASFRWGLVMGFVLTLLFTPVAGAETRRHLMLFWERYKQYFRQD